MTKMFIQKNKREKIKMLRLRALSIFRKLKTDENLTDAELNVLRGYIEYLSILNYTGGENEYEL